MEAHGAVEVGLGHVVGLDIELAQIFVRRLVVGLKLERLGVVGERSLVVAGLAQCEA